MESNVKIPFVSPEQLAKSEGIGRQEDLAKPKQLTRFDYLNRSFIPQGANEQHCEQHRVSGLAGDLWAMLATIEAAFDAESATGDGISTTLQIAKYMASDLIEMCEFLERDLNTAKKHAGEANA